MARARRHIRLPRLLVAESARDLAYNQAEVCRVLATERLDPDAARTMLWALQLSAAALRAESALRPRHIPERSHNSNAFYHVPTKPLFMGSYIKNPSQMPENTREREGDTQWVSTWKPTKGSVGW